MTFGKPMSPELLTFIQTNWNWDSNYKTKTTLLSGHVIHKEYDQQALLARFQEAANNDQGLSLVNFEDGDATSVKWRGNFTTKGNLIASPHYRMESFFDGKGRFLEQRFVQVEAHHE